MERVSKMNYFKTAWFTIKLTMQINGFGTIMLQSVRNGSLCSLSVRYDIEPIKIAKCQAINAERICIPVNE